MQMSGHALDHCTVVAVGGSGSQGLRDMQDLLLALPADLLATVLLTLHRPVDRASNLASVLQRSSRLPVEIAAQGRLLRPGVCYVGEPSRHLALGAPGRVRLVDDERRFHRNATVDLLFGSVAEHAGRQAIGVVLSGCLADGSRGLAAISQAGGIGMARVPCAHAVGDMPRNAIARAGPLSLIDTAANLGREIARRSAANDHLHRVTRRAPASGIGQNRAATASAASSTATTSATTPAHPAARQAMPGSTPPSAPPM